MNRDVSLLKKNVGNEDDKNEKKKTHFATEKKNCAQGVGNERIITGF